MAFGEKSGELVFALASASSQLESRRTQRALLAGALAYPAFAMVAAFGVCAFLVVSVIPKIAEFLESGGGELPAMTRNLVDAAAWLRANAIAVVAAAAGTALAFFAARRFPACRFAMDSAALRVPVAGRLLRISATAVFARALGVLVASGVALLDAIEVAGGLMANSRLSRRAQDARDAVLAGGALSPALAARGDWMPMLSRMVAVGEATGSLDDALGEVASFHETLLSAAIRRFGAVVEPAMIIVTGGIVGYVYVAFFVALFAMSGMS